jgi:hypothetical protein
MILHWEGYLRIDLKKHLASNELYIEHMQMNYTELKETGTSKMTGTIEIPDQNMSFPFCHEYYIYKRSGKIIL